MVEQFNETMTVVAYLERNADLYGEEEALIERDSANVSNRLCLTWRQFDDKANRVANYLLEAGYGKGKKVAILMYNCIEWLPIYFGVLKSGSMAVPLNFRYDSDEVLYCVELAEVDALIFGNEFVEHVRKKLGTIDNGRELIYVGDSCPDFAGNYYELVKDAKTDRPGISITNDDFAAIYFSSGTTGFPKAIMHKHQSLTQSAQIEQRHHRIGREDKFLCIPPLYHTGAKFHWMGSLVAGSGAVLLKGAKPENILSAISDEQCTIIWLLVPWTQDILDAIDNGSVKLADYRLDKLWLLHIGAQPVPPALIKRWKETFPHHEYDTTYGLTESTGPNCMHLGIENTHKVGAIGKAGWRWESKIVDEHDVPVNQGEVGELCVKGPGVMTCYYRDPEATAKTIVDGWLHTGDMAKEDEDGFVFLVDRKKDVIVSGGENIYPVQIENFLRANDKIRDVAVIGVPDKRLGEITAAVIEVKEECNMTLEEVNEFCEALPRYKRPRVVFFEPVPRNATGKIEKPKLRKLHGADNIVEKELGI